MHNYDLGETACLEIEIEDSEDSLADPATLSVVITKPSGAQLEYDESGPEIERESVGLYMLHPLCDEPGVWTWKAVSTEPSFAEQSEFYVRTDLEAE